MHMRRKPWARPELAACPWFISDPYVMAGKWRDAFPKKQPLWAEFGCGKGAFLANQAPLHPEVNFLGVDMISDVLGVARRAISNAYGDKPVENVLLTAFDLERLPHCMDESDRLDRLFIFFPNPWPKKPDRKKRLTHPKFLRRYQALMAPEAELWFKTDDRELFADTLFYLAEEHWKILENNDRTPEGHLGLPCTEHEARFRAEGKPIHFLRAVPPTEALRQGDCRKMNREEALNKLEALQKRMAAYQHAEGLLYYDGATAAPKGSAANRGETMAILSEEIYRMSTGPETAELLDYLYGIREELDPVQNRIVELMRKTLVEMRAVPMEEYVEYQKLLNESEDVWHTAKETDNYAIFAPYIDKIIAFLKKMAGLVEPEKDPYDYWLGNYEDGLTTEVCDAFFEKLRAGIVPLVQKVCRAKQVDTSCLQGTFPIEKQRILSDRLMELIGLDRQYCTIGETEHPFTTGFTKYDIRITTHYFEQDFASSMFSVIHEGGHALYDSNPLDEYAYTVLGGGVSMGIHESQSRFYENILGRSRGFVSTVLPMLQELFPEMEKVNAEELYRALNRSEPSLIRTEADELTYCLHIMVRYELEKKLFAGELTSAELPEAWNRLYKEYLGIDVPSDREGVLQDSHWSGGAFGYFPSYALGSAYGAQLLAVMKRDVDVDACMAKGDFAPVNAWLKEHIWQHGSLYKPGELFEKAVGTSFDPSYFVDYLEKKYSDIYGL